MTITNELKIKGDILQNEITNYKYDTTNFSELYSGQYSAYLLQNDIYTITGNFFLDIMFDKL